MTEQLPFVIPDDWGRLYDRVLTDPGVVFLMGAPDTGKTTLAHFLVYQGTKYGLKTAYIDGDLGQSVIGPPTTLGSAVVSTPPPDLAAVPPNHLYFIGATSPATHVLETVIGMKRLVDKAQAAGAQLTVVDTSGLVAGPLGFQLKFNKMQLLRPRHIVALQRDGEVEHILKAWSRRCDVELHRLGRAEMAKARSAEARRSYRQEKFTAYFQGSSGLALSLEKVAVLCPDLPLLSPARYDNTFKGRLIGFNDADYFTLGLGIWKTFDVTSGQVTLLTPVSDMQRVAVLHVGDIALDVA